jgi:hypothetical protein
MKYHHSKRHRAESSGVKLTEADAALVKGMLQRGDRQHDIAAWFGVNGGRIAEIATGFNFHWVVAADPSDLPPEGPYPSGRMATEAQRALDQALSALTIAETTLTSLRHGEVRQKHRQ